MDMTPDEIVVRYRQAKHKGEQLNILADLNACSVDEIVNVLVEHGGYKLEHMNRSRGKARLLKEEEEASKKPYKKPEIIPEPPKPIPVADIVKYKIPLKEVRSLEIKPQKLIDSALDVIKAEIEDINRRQYELDLAKADIYKKLWDMLGGVS